MIATAGLPSRHRAGVRRPGDCRCDGGGRRQQRLSHGSAALPRARSELRGQGENDPGASRSSFPRMAISAQTTTAQEQTMKAIINGKRYDTATATEVCDCSPEGEARLLEH